MITVIIAAYNSEKTIRRAIISALAEPEVSEVVVVDDDSKDKTVREARSSDDGTGRLRILVQEKNLGPSAARNRALRESSAPWVAVLDSDDFILSGRMRGLLALSEKYDLIADDLYQVDEGNEDGKRRTLLGSDVQLPMRVTLTEFILSNVTRGKFERSEMGFIKPLMRRDFLVRHELCYRENMRLGEDYELYTRALGLGAKLVILPVQGYVSVVRKSSLSSKHSEHDLLQLRNCDDDLMRDLLLEPQAYAALRHHRINTDCRLQWRLLIAAVKDRNVVKILYTFRSHPRVGIYLITQLWKEVVVRVLAKANTRKMGIPHN